MHVTRPMLAEDGEACRTARTHGSKACHKAFVRRTREVIDLAKKGVTHVTRPSLTEHIRATHAS